MTAYLITIFLSLLVAVAELFTKFQDEPFDVIRKWPALLYLFVNLLISCVCLYILTKTDIFGVAGEIDQLKAALTAGLGSTVLMRSKFLKANINGKEAAIGPEFIINVFLETLEKSIDRNRAMERKKMVEECMADIDFYKTKDYVVTTILASSQIDSPETARELINSTTEIAESPMEDTDKSYALGYLILDNMGEKFLKTLFHDGNRDRFTR
ncbi:hypothetical protein [Desulfonema magnum]|uniref:Uncharacterized protein n=1 Tax=Desulfonema magnum TaxID=45655 RepID=A0A975GL52_9BACT|nr:hypothetical protein [Desulfonema magnum]QTA85215.1 Uncharacterized protein dnm_012200 [Desulfonema magnum]